VSCPCSSADRGRTLRLQRRERVGSRVDREGPSLGRRVGAARSACLGNGRSVPSKNF
jgi:hypothetical protein